MLSFKNAGAQYFDADGKLLDSPIKGFCLSTDTKPAEAVNGSVLIEMDTGDVYLFDGDSEDWVKYTGEKALLVLI